jgi:hypothetical protein
MDGSGTWIGSGQSLAYHRCLICGRELGWFRRYLRYACAGAGHARLNMSRGTPNNNTRDRGTNNYHGPLKLPPTQKCRICNQSAIMVTLLQ